MVICDFNSSWDVADLIEIIIRLEDHTIFPDFLLFVISS